MKRKRTQRARRVKRLLVGIMLFAIVGSALWMLNIEERDEVRASVLPSNDRIAFLVRYSNGDAARIEIPLSALREGREGHCRRNAACRRNPAR
jgi:hypothetical protein